jgi:hypothetical protein
VPFALVLVMVVVPNALTVIVFVWVTVFSKGGGTVQPKVTVVNTVFRTEEPVGQKVAVETTTTVVALFVWIIVLLFVTN